MRLKQLFSSLLAVSAVQACYPQRRVRWLNKAGRYLGVLATLCVISHVS